MTIYKIDMIKELDDIFQHCYEKEQILLVIQKRKQNDARVTFYKHYLSILDSTIRLLILTDKYARDQDMRLWQNLDQEYNLNKRLFNRNDVLNYKAKIDYIDQNISNSYFGSIFNIFEHSFRLISEKYNDNIYSQQPSINGLFIAIMSKLNLNNSDLRDFINIVTRFRNSIHNNGVFNSPKDKNERYRWKETRYVFENGKAIEIKDIWNHYIKFTQEFVSIFDNLIGLQDIQKINYIIDITERSG
ncbi:MAG: hypothetical protein H0U27_12460 [Nitrosopumilus sp.]|nr:hypothetical protein [Nitrosopumilus sp.]